MSASNLKLSGASYSLGLNNDGFINGLKKAELALSSWGEAIKNHGRMVASAGALMMAPFVGALSSATSFAREITRISQQTGLSVESLSVLDTVASLTGNSLQQLANVYLKLEDSAGKLYRGNQEAANAFGELRLTWQQVKAMDPASLFTTVIDRLAELKDPTDRVRIGFALFGEQFREVLPLLNEGSAKLAELRAKIDKFQLKTSKEDISLLKEFGDSTTLLWASMRQLGIEVAVQVVPVARMLMEVVANGIMSFRQWIRENGNLVRSIFTGALAFTAYGASMLALGLTIKVVGLQFAMLHGLLLPVRIAIGGIVTASLAAKASLGGLFGVMTSLGQGKGGLFSNIITNLFSPKNFLAGMVGLDPKTILGAFGDIGKWITALIPNNFGGLLWGYLRGPIGFVGGQFLNAFSVIGSSLAPMFGRLLVSGPLRGLTTWVLTFNSTFLRAFAIIGSVGTRVFGSLGAAISKVIGLMVVGLARTALTTVGTIFMAFGTLAVGVLTTIGSMLLGLIGSVVAFGVKLAVIGYVGFLIWQYAAPRIMSAWRNVAPTILNAFDRIKTVGILAFGGIVDAVKAGDLELAMQIAFLGIRILWIDLMQFFRTSWAALEPTLIAIWDRVFDYIKKAWNNIFGPMIALINPEVAGDIGNKINGGPEETEAQKIAKQIAELFKVGGVDFMKNMPQVPNPFPNDVFPNMPSTVPSDPFFTPDKIAQLIGEHGVPVALQKIEEILGGTNKDFLDALKAALRPFNPDSFVGPMPQTPANQRDELMRQLVNLREEAANMAIWASWDVGNGPPKVDPALMFKAGAVGTFNANVAPYLANDSIDRQMLRRLDGIEAGVNELVGQGVL